MRKTASPFVIGRIIVSDLESDGFIAKLEDTKLYDYLETKGQVESFLNNIDMPSDYVVNLEFVIEKEPEKHVETGQYTTKVVGNNSIVFLTTFVSSPDNFYLDDSKKIIQSPQSRSYLSTVLAQAGRSVWSC